MASDIRHAGGAIEERAVECDNTAMMRIAVEEMHLSKSEGGKPTPLVGAVVCFPDGKVVKSHRSEFRNGDHAEYTLFERKLRTTTLDDAKLYVTLEPCAPGARSADKTGCAQRIVDARIKEVWIGCLDPYPTVAGQGRRFLEEHGVIVHDFDPGLCDEIREVGSEFFAYAEEVERAEAAGGGLVDTVRRLLENPQARIELNDAIVGETERLRGELEGPQPTIMVEPEDFARWLDGLTVAAAPLARAFANIAFWGRAEDAAIMLRALARLTRWPISGGIVIVLNTRVYPALVALYAAGVAAVHSGNYAMLAMLLRGRVSRSTSPYPRPDELLPVPVALNASEVLDRTEMNLVLNIGVEQPMRFHVPESVYLERKLKALVSDLVVGDAEYQLAFDSFECLLALRYIVEGGDGLPAGSFMYRGKRSFTMSGVPERLRLELGTEGAGWGPIAGGVFQSVDEATSAFDAMVQRLANASWYEF